MSGEPPSLDVPATDPCVAEHHRTDCSEAADGTATGAAGVECCAAYHEAEDLSSEFAEIDGDAATARMYAAAVEWLVTDAPGDPSYVARIYAVILPDGTSVRRALCCIYPPRAPPARSARARRAAVFGPLLSRVAAGGEWVEMPLATVRASAPRKVLDYLSAALMSADDPATRASVKVGPR
eukprot:TRINITY_DN67447_c0_g1_i1.p2 TRINITY_DN67447_c0_g1~~TRINITY_DN67447_c0_g1_i1.p2  ORF type:complete len:181 (-),score=17.30 TRINITY_DN67447_c0_g1_i1:91-633(-)